MKKILPLISIIVSYYFAFLFCYVGVSKLLDFENFQVQLAQSPLLSAYAGFVSHAIIVLELITVILLCIPKTQLVGLYTSFVLMVGFTTYIYLILNYSDFIPCSCGGIIEKLDWRDHLIFNITGVILALCGIFSIVKLKTAHLTKPVLYTSLSFVMVIVAVLGMFISSEHIIKKENNFTRRFLNHPIMEDKTIKLDNSNYYFAGNDDGFVYLGNRNQPQDLTYVDTSLTRVAKIKITPDNLNHTFKSIQIQVKAPYYYLFDGTVPIIYRGKLGNPDAQTISFQDAYFTQLVVLDSMKFALRTQSRQSKELTIASLNLQSSPKLHLYPHILEKQIDGVFDVDGKLITTTNASRLIYTYTYRNQFIVMDDSFKVERRLNTIDTTSTAHVKITKLSDGKYKMNSPPLKVNHNTRTNRNLLFNQSDLMGKHESKVSWNKAAVVDIYRTDLKEYIGSFYIYKKEDKSISDFLITDKYLFVLRGNEITRYYYRTPITLYFKQEKAENL